MSSDATGSSTEPRPEPRPDTVLFDVDGTLVDSNYQHVVAWASAFHSVGIVVPAPVLHRVTGMGGDQLVAAVAGDDVEREHGDAVRAAWREAFDGLVDDVPALPGAADLLRACAAAGLKVVLATSSPAELLEHYRRLLDADDALAATTSSSDVEASKPAGDIYGAAAAKVGAQRAVAVGDSPWDAQSAHAAGVGVVLVRSGGFCDDLLRERAPHAAFYDGPAQLLEQLDGSPLLPPH